MMADIIWDIFQEPDVSDEEFLQKKEAINYWMCDECIYVFEANTLPDTFPGCDAKCTFMNVSCYITDCSRQGHYGPKLAAQPARETEKRLK